MSEITNKTSATASELAELLGDGNDVTIIVQAVPPQLAAALEFKETLQLARNRVRQSNMLPMQKLLFYEQSFIAEDAGCLDVNYTSDEIKRNTGMGARTITRHHEALVSAKAIRIDNYGQGGRKSVAIIPPERTLAELSLLTHQSKK